MLGTRAKRGLPADHLRRPERRLAEVVDDENEAGEAQRQLGDVAEVIRIDDGELEQEPCLLDQGDALEHARLHDPMWIGLVVDQMANPAEPRVPSQLSEPAPARLGVVECDPRRDGSDPGVLGRPARRGSRCRRRGTPPARARSARCRTPRAAEAGRSGRTSSRSPRARPSSTAAASARDPRSAGARR